MEYDEQKKAVDQIHQQIEIYQVIDNHQHHKIK
jgi:hypothetical protein